MTDQFDLEPTVVYLINANNRQLSFVNSYYTGLIAIACYKNRTHIEYWKILPLIQDEIQGGSLQAIIIFGVFAKLLGEKIIMIMRDMIRILLRINETRFLPFVVQCFRRIIKGTDSYIFDEAIEVIDYISRGLNSPNNEIKMQCIKTLPVIMKSIKLGMKRLFSPVESHFDTKNTKLRFVIAKSLAKMIYFTGQQQDQSGFGNTVYDAKKPYKVCFSTILDYAKNEKFIPLLCHTLMIWVRFLKPDDLSKKISLFTKFALSIVSLNLPLPYACTFSRTIFRAVTSVIGSTYDPLICHYVFDDSKKEGFGMLNTAITLDTLINFRASAKTIKKAAKSFYQLLATKDKEIVRLICSFFVVVGRRDSKTSQILVDSFISWLNSPDIKPLEINGYSRGIAILVMTANIANSSILKIHDIIRNWLPEPIERTDPRFSAALLMCTAVFKRSPIDFPMQIILLAFKQLPRLFRNGEKITEENIELNTPMKFGAMLMKQVIMSNIETLLSLEPTIQQVSVVVTHNAGYLSSPTLLSMWLAIRTCKAAWHISLPQSIFIATPTILARFFNPAENSYDWGMRQCIDDIDPCELLYKTNLPSQFHSISSDKMETIYTLILSDVRTPMREELVKIVLRDYAPWSIFCSTTVLKSTCAALFSPEREKEKLLYQVRLMCINAITKKSFIGEFIRKDALKVLLSIPSTDIRTIRMQGAAIASLVNLLPENYDELLDYIEEPTSSTTLIAAIISELNITKEREVDGIRCLLALERLMVTDPHPLLFFAMLHLIDINIITSDFIGQTFEVLEDVAFNDAIRSQETAYYLSMCVQQISNNDDKLRKFVSDTYLHHVFNKNQSLLFGLQMKSPSDRTISIKYDFTIDKPRPILNAYFKYLESAKDIPIILGIIQQGYADGDAKMRELFFRFKNVNFWVFVCRLVIIKGTVPFVGTNMRVSPSIEVIHAMILIADLITQQIFINYPSNKDKIEELLSFPTAVLTLKDFSVHECAYKMLNTFVSLFSEVKDTNGNLELNNYANTIQDAFKTVFDDSHKLSDGLTFALSYYKFLKSQSMEFEADAYKYIIDTATVAIQNDPITFIRIAGKLMDILNKPIPEIQAQFAEKVANFITNVCKQTRMVKELDNEVYTTIATYIKIKGTVQLEWTFTLALLWEMLTYGFNESMLKLLMSLIMRNKKTDKDMINYVLFVFGRSSLFNNPHMDISTMRVIGECLGVTASLIPRFAEGWEDTWEYTLSLSLSSFNSYRALALLLRCGSTKLIMQVAGPFVASIIHDDIKYSGALLNLLFYRIPSSVIDQIIPYVVRGEYAPYEKFNVLLHMLRSTGKTALMNFEDISRLTSFFFFDEGGLFVGNLLSDDRTDVYGINLLRLGIADSIFRANITVEQLTLVSNLLYLATQKIKKLFPLDYWEKTVANFAINQIMSHPDATHEQVSQLVQILNLIDRDILKEAYNSVTDPETLITILTPLPPTREF